MAVKPFTPQEVDQQKQASIPDAVIVAVNELLVKHWNRNSRTATIKQDAVVLAISTAMNVGRQVVFDNGWLDFEDLYRSQGWEVEYDKPGYCETYEASFKFTQPTRRGSFRD